MGWKSVLEQPRSGSEGLWWFHRLWCSIWRLSPVILGANWCIILHIWYQSFRSDFQVQNRPRTGPKSQEQCKQIFWTVSSICSRTFLAFSVKLATISRNQHHMRPLQVEAKLTGRRVSFPTACVVAREAHAQRWLSLSTTFFDNIVQGKWLTTTVLLF